MMKKLSAALALLLAASTITACGPDDNNDTTPNCAAGEINVPAGSGDLMAGCYETCTSSSDCETGYKCNVQVGTDKICAPSGDMPKPDMDTRPDMDTTPDMPSTMVDMPNTMVDMPNTMVDMPNTMVDMPNTMPDMPNTGGPNTGAACTADTDCTGMDGQCFSFPDGYCVSSCQSDANCGANGACVSDGQGNNICVASCTDDSDCRDKYECSQIQGGAICLPIEAPPANLGAACADDADCDAGSLSAFCAVETDGEPPGGQCLAIGCTLPDTAMENSIFLDAGCGEGNLCQAISGQGGLIGACLPGCSENSACDRAVTAGSTNVGFSCDVLGSVSNDFFGTDLQAVGICSTACSSNTDCARMDANGMMIAGYCNNERACEVACDSDADCGGADSDFKCTDRGNGLSSCEYAPTPGDTANGTGVVGDACTKNSDCAGGAGAGCIDQFTDGYCSVDCTPSAGGAACPAGSLCVGVDQNSDLALCLDNCSGGANDCRTGYDCLDLMTGQVAAGGVAGVCVPQ